MQPATGCDAIPAALFRPFQELGLRFCRIPLAPLKKALMLRPPFFKRINLFITVTSYNPSCLAHLHQNSEPARLVEDVFGNAVSRRG